MAKGDGFYKLALKEATSVPENNEKAFNYLQKAAQKNNAKALYALATWYIFGKHVKKNLKKGVGLLIQSTENDGPPEAFFDLAISYELGKGVDKDATQAFKNYLLAMAKGDQNAIYEVGRCFYHGIGVEKNPEIGQSLVDLFSQIEEAIKTES